MGEQPDIHRLGRRNIELSWEEVISEKLLYFMLEMKDQILQHCEMEIEEIVSTFNSLLIKYTEPVENYGNQKEFLTQLVSKMRYKGKIRKVKQYELPVCYAPKFGPDLKRLSTEMGASLEEIIALHTNSTYTVYFTGFLPGFLYLGGLPEALYFPRRDEPRLHVKSGAVGIGGKQTGIYPQSSAGGWQIIGDCPIPLFRATAVPPSPFQPGDRIRFNAITPEEYQIIKEQGGTGAYQLHAETVLI